jgi:hypothetical protein
VRQKDTHVSKRHKKLGQNVGYFRCPYCAPPRHVRKNPKNSPKNAQNKQKTPFLRFFYIFRPFGTEHAYYIFQKGIIGMLNNNH